MRNFLPVIVFGTLLSYQVQADAQFNTCMQKNAKNPNALAVCYGQQADRAVDSSRADLYRRVEANVSTIEKQTEPTPEDVLKGTPKGVSDEEILKNQKSIPQAPTANYPAETQQPPTGSQPASKSQAPAKKPVKKPAFPIRYY